MKIKIDAADKARIAAIIAKAVKDYIHDDQRATYPLPGDVWITIKSKRVAGKIRDGFVYTTSDGALTIRKIDAKRVMLTAHAFPRSAKLWNGPDVLANDDLASMFASLFHDLLWGKKREIAEATGLSVAEVLRWANDVFFIAWRAIDSSLLGRIKSRLAFRAVTVAVPWYHRLKGSTAAFAVSALATGAVGCVSLPDGEADEIGGVEIVQQVMHDYGDGLGPDPVESKEER